MYRQLVRLWCGLVELRFVFAVERGSCFFAVFDPDCLPGLSFFLRVLGSSSGAVW